MPKVSIIIPTHDRPELLPRAIRSVLNQTFRDFEIIVVDDGLKARAAGVIKQLSDPRIIYIQHEKESGGSAARNTGIKNSKGRFVAFLDDDDEWMPEKLEVQMKEFENTPPDVGFCFCAVKNIYKDREAIKDVPEGVINYFETALSKLNGLLTSTFLVKRMVFEVVGYFDENLASHQDAELIIRMSKKYKALGINRPLVLMDMEEGAEHIGGNVNKKIRGRESVIKKHRDDYKKRPNVLAFLYFGLGMLYRNNGQISQARQLFFRAFITRPQIIYLFHFLILIPGAWFLNLIRKIKKFLLAHEPFKPGYLGPWLRNFYFDYYFKHKVGTKNLRRVLDAGCGKGQYAEKLAIKMPWAQVTGYDIKEYPEWGGIVRPNLKFNKFDLNDLADENRYDFILSIDSLEHIPNNRGIMMKFYKALGRDGYLYIAIPNEAKEFHFFPRKLFCENDKWVADEHIGEQYDLGALEDILEEIGFQIICGRRTFTFWGRLAWEFSFLFNKGNRTVRRIGVLLMPVLKIFCILDFLFPMGSGANLVICRKV